MQGSKYTYICLRFLFANVIFVKEKFNLSDIFAKINCFGIQRRSKINYVKIKVWLNQVFSCVSNIPTLQRVLLELLKYINEFVALLGRNAKRNVIP